MPSYNRLQSVDANPGGDSVKQACIDLDADLTGAFAAANDLDSKVATHAALSAAHGVTGAVVGTTDAQVLTNKTLTAPKINEDVAVTATATELNYCDGVTSGIQAQLNAKEPSITAGSAAQYFKGDKSLGTFATDVLSAASGKQDTLVAATNIKTINGVSPLGSGDMAISISPYAFDKLSAQSVAFIKTAAGTASIRANTFVVVAGAVVSFLTDTALTMPSHAIGTDYYIYACSDGTCRADASSSAPTGYTTANSRLIGGYHYGRVRNTLTVTDVAVEIVPRSMWDLAYRPKCAPQGMVDVRGDGSLWADIYPASVNAAITLTSGVVTAGSCKSAYNSTALTGTEGLNSYNFFELAKNSSKRLLSYQEWCQVAHGSPQGNDADNLNAWTKTTNTARNPTGLVDRAVSFAGACDCVGNVWEWLSDFSNDHTTTAYIWQNPMAGQSVGQFYIPNATGVHQYSAGGNWSVGVIAGARCLNANNYPWAVGPASGCRFACDGI